MRFVIIDPRKQTVSDCHADSLDDVYPQAGLDRMKCDHGFIRPLSVGFIVYEFGLFDPPVSQSYFGLFGRFLAGNCILYGVDSGGETVDVETVPATRFFGNDLDAIERAFAACEVHRPVMTFQGDVIWKWPEPAPKGMGHR